MLLRKTCPFYWPPQVLLHLEWEFLFRKKTLELIDFAFRHWVDAIVCFCNKSPHNVFTLWSGEVASPVQQMFLKITALATVVKLIASTQRRQSFATMSPLRWRHTSVIGATKTSSFDQKEVTEKFLFVTLIGRIPDYHTFSFLWRMYGRLLAIWVLQVRNYLLRFCAQASLQATCVTLRQVCHPKK